MMAQLCGMMPMKSLSRPDPHDLIASSWAHVAAVSTSAALLAQPRGAIPIKPLSRPDPHDLITTSLADAAAMMLWHYV